MKGKQGSIHYSFLLIILLGVFSSCLKNKLEPVGDEDIVFSSHDSTANFSSYTKYVLIDSIGKLNLTNSSTTDSLLEDPYKTIILNQIDINLLSYGYIKVDSVDSADVLINVNVLIDPTENLISQYSFVNQIGEFEAAWWQHEHYRGHPAYWGVNAIPLYRYEIPDYFTSSSGTLIIEMIDRHSLDTVNQKIFVPWFSGVRSIFSGSNIQSRLVQTVNQCFAQSQYLSH